MPKLGRIFVIAGIQGIYLQKRSYPSEIRFRHSGLRCACHNPSFSGIFPAMSDYLRFFILLAAGWINRDQQKIIDYLIEEIVCDLAFHQRNTEPRWRREAWIHRGVPGVTLYFCKRGPRFMDQPPVQKILIIALSISSAAPPVWRGGLSSCRTGTWEVPDDNRE